MQSLRQFVWCYGFVLFLFLPARARAECSLVESIEWLLADSDRVVVGKISKVEKVVGDDHLGYELATVEVSKTFKGPDANSVTFVLHNFHDAYAKQWMDEGIPQFFFLVKNDGKRIPIPTEKCAWGLRFDHKSHDAILLGKSKHTFTYCVRALSRDFDVLTDEASIIKCLDQAADLAEDDRRVRGHKLNVPSDTPVSNEFARLGAGVVLVVPVDEKLEALGRKRCKSKSPFDREEGAKILRHFKNDNNFEILKGLLADTYTSEETLHRTVRGKSELELVSRKNIYIVRKAAFDALKEFGVKVDRPILEELLEGRDEPE